MTSVREIETSTLSTDIVHAFDKVNGVHPGFRPAHAKGILVSGEFVPSGAGRMLSTAPHLHRGSTPVTIRFSDSTGFPNISDTDANASPRGMALRFHLGEHTHTDIIAHSTDGFPTRTAEEFLELLGALAVSGPDVTSPKPIETYLATHPAALRFLQMTGDHISASFVKEHFYAVNAYKFTNDFGLGKYGRYRVCPQGEAEHLHPPLAAGTSPDYLFEDLQKRLAAGPQTMQIKVQLAENGDIVDDSTVRWPAERPLIDIGSVELLGIMPDSETAQRHIIFDPIPRVQGIEPSGDPLLEPRAAAYLMSGRRRRAGGTS